MIAAIYSRKSKYTGQGESIENQIQLCKEYALKNLDIDEGSLVIYEDEGFSGSNTNRPQFRKMLQDAKAGKLQIIICYRLDRISRSISDFANLIEALNRDSIGFISIREQFDTTTPMGRAMMYIASVFSQLERETIAERIKDNMLQLAKTGRWLGGVPPTGYRSQQLINIDSKGKSRKLFTLSPIENEVKLVKLIYKQYLKLKSITQVEKYLLENQIKTKNESYFNRHSIRLILSNPVYASADPELYDYLIQNQYDLCSEKHEFDGQKGLMSYNKTNQAKTQSSKRYRDNSQWIIAVGLHEGIIPGDQWIKAQNLLTQNRSKAYRKPKGSAALLSGLLRCAYCGSFMRPKTIQRTAADGRQVYYYICELKDKSRKSQCIIPNINGNTLDGQIIDELKDFMINNTPVIGDKTQKTKKNFPALQAFERADAIAQSLCGLDDHIWKLMSTFDIKNIGQSTINDILWDGKKICIIFGKN